MESQWCSFCNGALTEIQGLLEAKDVTSFDIAAKGKDVVDCETQEQIVLVLHLVTAAIQSQL